MEDLSLIEDDKANAMLQGPFQSRDSSLNLSCSRQRGPECFEVPDIVSVALGPFARRARCICCAVSLAVSSFPTPVRQLSLGTLAEDVRELGCCLGAAGS